MGRYPVPLVGEKHYQPAIKASNVGDVVHFEPEPNNPHDPKAVLVTNGTGNVLGYLPRDGWLTRLIVDEGGMPLAQIKSINGHGRGKLLGVVLEVATAGENLAQSRNAQHSPSNGKGAVKALSSLISGFLRGISK